MVVLQEAECGEKEARKEAHEIQERCKQEVENAKSSNEVLEDALQALVEEREEEEKKKAAQLVEHSEHEDVAEHEHRYERHS